jgi:hypothetical protein
MRKEVLEMRTRVLGEEHPNTISAMNNLAITLRKLHQLGEAVKMEKEVLEKRRRILGKQNPDTTSEMANLIPTHGDSGQRDAVAKAATESQICSTTVTFGSQNSGF